MILWAKCGFYLGHYELLDGPIADWSFCYAEECDEK